MLFTFSNNIKISSHGLINNLISNASHTIIFHIIQTFMLTHQLACINISFSNTHFKPFNSTTTVLSFSHHSCSSCQAKSRVSLSKNPTLFSLLFTICSSHRPSPPPPPPPPNWLVNLGQENCPLLPHVNLSLVDRITLILLSTYFGFPSN